MSYRGGKWSLHSSVAFLVWVGALVFGFVFTSIVRAAPFGEFATALTLGAGSYFAKRHFDKKFNNTEESKGERRYYE